MILRHCKLFPEIAFRTGVFIYDRLMTEGSMKPGPIDYGALIRDGLRSVMSRSLAHTVEHGLYGEQHFYITYLTGHSGVVMPDWLR